MRAVMASADAGVQQHTLLPRQISCLGLLDLPMCSLIFQARTSPEQTIFVRRRKAAACCHMHKGSRFWMHSGSHEWLVVTQGLAARTDAKIIVVLIHGGPLAIEWLEASPRVSAILTAWMPGQV